MNQPYRSPSEPGTPAPCGEEGPTPEHGELVLASRSPRRLELLNQLVPGRVRSVPPRDMEEAGFDDARTVWAIEQRLREIARGKADDVLRQLRQDAGQTSPGWLAVVAADTVIAVPDRTGITVLGQPPADRWQETVTDWFRNTYRGRTHLALTGLCIETPAGKRSERVVSTEVTFTEDIDRWLDWYLATGEPQGKAGGYALQGLGSVLISQVTGSLSNVIGLPLETVMDIFEELAIPWR